MIDFLWEVQNWSDATKWHSWVLHGVLAIPLTLIFGAYATVVFYLLREVEQYLHTAMCGVSEGLLDSALDWVVPSAVAIVITRL